MNGFLKSFGFVLLGLFIVSSSSEEIEKFEKNYPNIIEQDIQSPSGTYFNYDTNVLNIEWMRIPAGEFLMGDNFGDGDDRERPVHAVLLSEYYISKYEVTFDQFDTYCDDMGYTKPPDAGWGRGNRPAINVSWYAAQSFCDWLSTKTGKNVHLPTEAQWEKAARGIDQRRYPWGNADISCALANCQDCNGKTMPVGSYPSGISPYGVHDMAGNVYEWCQDWFSPVYYSESPYYNPQGPPDKYPSPYYHRVMRGGSCCDPRHHCRSYQRPWSPPPYDIFDNIGFRLVLELKDDLIGTWNSSGVWYRNADTGSWVLMTTPANLVASGDIDGDGTDDLIGVWSSGLWVKYSSSGSWGKLSTTLPTDIASGDMNGDGRDDILGTWASGVWYKSSIGGSWVKMTTPAQMVTAGDLDGDGTDDLIGVWSNGLWIKSSQKNIWYLITSVLPTSIASGDMNGDGRDDILGTWPSGVWYGNSIGVSWVKISTPAHSVAAGDIDGDNTDDLIGTWSSGLWVKTSSTASWQFICTSLPSDIDAGLFSARWGAGAVRYDAPIGGMYAEGPDDIGDYEDLTSESPGGWNFVYEEDENLKPPEIEVQRMMRTPGPGEPGFRGIEQTNLVPRQSLDKKINKK